MAQINGDKFTLAWSQSPEQDLAGYRLFFGPTVDVGYDAPVVVDVPADQTSFDQDGLPGDPPVDEASDMLYVRIAAVDDAKNVSDLSPAVDIPFDRVPPGPVGGFRLA